MNRYNRFDPTTLNMTVRRSSSHRIMDFLAKFHVKKEKRKPTEEFKMTRCRVHYSDMYKKNVIFYRYNSLKDISNPVKTKHQISKRFRLPMSTVNLWIKKHTAEKGSLWKSNRFKGRPK